MIGTTAGLTLQVGAIALMPGGVVHNQLAPSYDTALAVPLFNAIAIALSLLGLTSAVLAYRHNRDSPLARYTVAAGGVCAIVLIALFPLSNSGTFSLVH